MRYQSNHDRQGLGPHARHRCGTGPRGPRARSGATGRPEEAEHRGDLGDDIGYWNVSAYNHGMMGYKNAEHRSNRQGRRALLPDWYGQRVARGRAAFITGRNGFRTGLLKVGLPGAREGLQARDVTIARLLEAQGYATAQFGKNHLGDLDGTCPPRTASMSSSVRCITSTPRRSSETRITQGSGADQTVSDARRDPHVGQRRWHAANREHGSARQETDGDRRRGNLPRPPSTTWTRRSRRASPSSCGGTPPACT